MLSAIRSPFVQSVRLLNTSAVRSISVIPEPRGKVTDVEGFMKSIGRSCPEVAGKFESWDQLFTCSSRTMKNSLGISVKQRRYILSWRERYRQGHSLTAIGLPSPKKKKSP
ncbi:IGR protein motif-domain-containing protein [Spinellus fusiger]|nr:IGR protein motif-domain-containing protein [Spinellus fusiger]KAI7862267.1 IGR protein motif-domain-containing protein [Spinellus fusiger]